MSAEEPATGLDELYDLVPQAEEIDLREELALEAQRNHWLGELRPLLGPAEPDDTPDALQAPEAPDVADEPDESDEPWRLTDRQVVGLVEHVLGAEQVDDRADRDH